MIQAIDPNTIIRYVPKGDRGNPPEKQTVFFLKPLTARQSAILQDGITEILPGKKGGETTLRIMSGSKILKALESGLVGWENFHDAQGQPVVWRGNSDQEPNGMLNYIPADIRHELSEVIIEGRELPDQIAKK